MGQNGKKLSVRLNITQLVGAVAMFLIFMMKRAILRLYKKRATTIYKGSNILL